MTPLHNTAASARFGHSLRFFRMLAGFSVTLFCAGESMALTQTISMADLPAKTYGDAPFIVTATASSGLPITKWESSDPAVATISQTGEVTVVGAGQTSIIASNSGDATYTAAWVAKPLNVARSAAPLPSGTQTVTYNGSAQGLDAATLPAGLATQTSYRDTTVPEATPTPEVVFQNGPDELALSYLSTGLQATGNWGLAKYASLGGTARKLHSCDVTLISWAGYYGGKLNNPVYRYKEWADAHPEVAVPPTPGISVPGDSGGFYHPVTLAFYDYVDGANESYRLLTSRTVQAFIPWRPEKQADGVTDYPYDGYAFRVPFSFPDGVILPQEVWVAVSFNTQSYGISPIGASGPYNALNISRPSGQQVGSTLLGTYTLAYKNWRWLTSSGAAGPMLRLYAVPTNATLAPPVNAGSYEVKTQAAYFSPDSSSSSILQIDKAQLNIELTDLTQVRDGSPKPVTVTTTPGGIATSVTYGVESSPDAPSDLGSYPVTASSANPNYEGQTNGTLWIGDTFASWQTAAFDGSGLPPEDTAGPADPDGDGLSNFLEYASNFNPLLGDQPSPTGYEHGATLGFTYRRNLHALDLEYSIQGSTNLADAQSWALVTPLGEVIVSDDGSTRVIRASVEKPANEPKYFLRLKIKP